MAVLVVTGVVAYFVYEGVRQRTIERVLAADKGLYERLAAEATLLDVAWDKSGITGRYYVGLQKIDLSGCPDDFQAAFREHIRAWLGYAEFAARYGGFRGFFRGFFSPNPLGTVVTAASEASEAEQKIRSTWDEVTRLARKYGAKVP